MSTPTPTVAMPFYQITAIVAGGLAGIFLVLVAACYIVWKTRKVMRPAEEKRMEAERARWIAEMHQTYGVDQGQHAEYFVSQPAPTYQPHTPVYPPPRTPAFRQHVAPFEQQQLVSTYQQHNTAFRQYMPAQV